MCPKPKHLKHLIFEVLVGDLGVERFVVETLFGKIGRRILIKNFVGILPRRVVEIIIMSIFESCFQKIGLHLDGLAKHFL